MNRLDSKTCNQLQQRLQNAEAAVRQALESAEEGTPLRAATEELMNAHRDIRKLLHNANDKEDSTSEPNTDEVVKAEIEIGREEHEMKFDAKDVIKAIFMWKDDPSERANERSVS